MNPSNQTFNRRQMITRLLGGTTLMAATSRFAASAAAAESNARYPIGACDWSIGKMADPTGLGLAKEIGLDGLQVSLGTETNDMHLRREEVQQQYLKASEETGVKIASLAIGELNRVPYKSDPRTIEWVNYSVDVCRAMDCRVVLLAFFGNGDLKGDKAGTDEVVRRLKDVAPKAEEKGVTLGIESWLSADEHLDIIERVGSSAVKVYYDVANSHKMGYDIYEEIRRLGKQGQICEFHMKENGALLGKGKIDFNQVKAAVGDIGYRGWLQIEGAVPAGGEIKASYIANRKFLQSLFGRG